MMSSVTLEKRKKLFSKVKSQKFLLLLVIPAVIWVIIFNYLPMYGLVVSFQNYDVLKGFFASQWVGLANYKELFTDSFFLQSLKTTIIIGVLKIIIGFPMPLLFALSMHRKRNKPPP